MKGRFRFPLATVLQVARLREEAARLRLAQALARAALSRRAVEETQRLLARRLAEMGEDAPLGRPPEEFLLRLRHLEQLNAAMAGWRDRLAQEEAEAEKERHHLLSRHRERRLLERLEEKARARFRRELLKYLERETEATVLCRFPLWQREDEG